MVWGLGGTAVGEVCDGRGVSPSEAEVAVLWWAGSPAPPARSFVWLLLVPWQTAVRSLRADSLQLWI